VGGEKDAAQLQLCWKERGGPCVEAPERRGFGSRLIKASLPDAEVAFAPEGVTCTLRVSV
jgi:two-component sensor histidine kinase